MANLVCHANKLIRCPATVFFPSFFASLPLGWLMTRNCCHCKRASMPQPIQSAFMFQNNELFTRLSLMSKSTQGTEKKTQKATQGWYDLSQLIVHLEEVYVDRGRERNCCRVVKLAHVKTALDGTFIIDPAKRPARPTKLSVGSAAMVVVFFLSVKTVWKNHWKLWHCHIKKKNFKYQN